MPGRHIELPKTGYAIEIDGILKSQFPTKRAPRMAPPNWSAAFRRFAFASTTPPSRRGSIRRF